MHGIVLLDKPLGLSSNAALQRVRRLYDRAKAGHAGTLDPLATGMLPIFLGEATKFIQHVISAHKAYRATIAFGSETATADREGDIVVSEALPTATRAELDTVLLRFVGRIHQRPPMYSAIKRDGVPMYKLARQGEQVEVPEREVEIKHIEVIAYSPDALELDVICGSGTYIRSLGVDIGRALGSAAHLAELRRRWVSPFETLPMVSLETLNDSADPSVYVLPIDRAMTQFPAITLDIDALTELKFGRRVTGRAENDGRYRLYAIDGSFVGLGMTDAKIMRADRLMATG
ncbi:MAG: tRNA pseudouridine(55) synthase TruB [Rhodanobacteraceae bacterium]|nr:tRNA pseudouridine(55) synthase TruB [Rhodanobacteraceae bacterium]MBP9153435.1 tRNA pseudouridine(55) synthase TruB [Xanthomonadales bacterium]HQW81948.1 tRNA pseudouridine(55) synthase TruB [Pseudomonadota bacterium]